MSTSVRLGVQSDMRHTYRNNIPGGRVARVSFNIRGPIQNHVKWSDGLNRQFVMYCEVEIVALVQEN